MENKSSSQNQTKPTPDLETLMHMGIFIPTEVNQDSLTEKGKELNGSQEE